MAGSAKLVVYGYRDLNRAFAEAGKDTKKELTGTLKDAAEPVRLDAERLAVSSIRRMTPEWARMRTGVTSRLVYVAPRARSRGRGDDPRRRPQFATLMMSRALEPALSGNAAEVEQRIDRMLDGIADDFNHGKGF